MKLLSGLVGVALSPVLAVAAIAGAALDIDGERAMKKRVAKNMEDPKFLSKSLAGEFGISPPESSATDPESR